MLQYAAMTRWATIFWLATGYSALSSADFDEFGGYRLVFDADSSYCGRQGETARSGRTRIEKEDPLVFELQGLMGVTEDHQI